LETNNKMANLTEKIDCKEEEETRVFSAEDFFN
jgi:hypothetical protein